MHGGVGDLSFDQKQESKTKNSWTSSYNSSSNIALAEAYRNNADKIVERNPHHPKHVYRVRYYITHLHHAADVIPNVRSKINVMVESKFTKQFKILPQCSSHL
jgi:hypothetical protein